MTVAEKKLEFLMMMKYVKSWGNEIQFEDMRNMILKDKDVRDTLLHEIDNEYKNIPDTVVISELGLLQGLCRIDVAVLNGVMHGYEIKSDADTLERLPTQISFYNKVLDKLTLVVGEKHLKDALDITPEWWGIRVASGGKSTVTLQIYREECQNENIDPHSVVELLWRQEVVDILVAKNVNNKFLRRPKSELYQLLVSEFPLQEIKDMTRTILKNRINWRCH